MATRIIQEAQYVIQQFDNNVLVLEETLPSATLESIVVARATELENANPALVTQWFFRSEVTEQLQLDGIVVETPAGNARLFDIEGATAARAFLNGVELSLIFLAQDANPGDIVTFEDASGVLVAETVL